MARVSGRVLGMRKMLVWGALISVLVGCSRDSGPVAIDTLVACGACVIASDSLVTLANVDFVGPSTHLARSSQGRYYVGDLRSRTIRVFGNSGTVLHDVGRRGAGPGEFESFRNLLVDSAGTLHVLDATLSRHSVFDTAGKFISSRRIPVASGLALHAVLANDGSLIVNVRPMSARDSISPILVIDSAGTGTALPGQAVVALPRRPWASARLLTRIPGGGVLVARPYAFTIDMYDATLQRARSIVRNTSWIPLTEPLSPPSDGVLDEPYTPELRAAWVDSAGHLWMHSTVPVAAWKPGPSMQQASTMTPDEILQVSNRPRMESIVEVIDIRRGVVLARTRAAQGDMGLPFGEGYYAKTVVGATGEPGLRISRLLLKQ